MQISIKFDDNGYEADYSDVIIKSKKTVEHPEQWVDMLGRVASLAPYRLEYMLGRWLCLPEFDIHDLVQTLDSDVREELLEYLTSLKKVQESVQPEVTTPGSTLQTESDCAED